VQRGKRIKLFVQVFEREWNKRFQTVDKNGNPIKKSIKWLDYEKLTEEEKEYEDEISESIGEYLDSVLEQMEAEEQEEKQ